jgi:hypothetical protein
MATLTTANSSFALVLPNLYPAGQTIQGYAADDMFTYDATEITETVMGVDGKMSIGFIYSTTKQTIMIMPNSPSYDIFDNWRTSQIALKDALFANATWTVPSIRKIFTFTNGALKSMKSAPDAKKLLGGVPVSIEWERVIGATY